MDKFSFQIGHVNLSIDALLGKSRQHDVLAGLIDYIKSSDSTHEVYEPMESDINSARDTWEVHVAFHESLIFEFLEGKLIYIAFDLRRLEKDVIFLPSLVMDINAVDDLNFKGQFVLGDSCFQTIIDSSIVLAFLLDDDLKKDVNVIAFGDITVFSDENRLPNRYSELLGGLVRS